MKTLIYKAFWQAVVIFLIAAAVGIGINQIRKEKLPLTGNWQPSGADSGDTIGLAEAHELHAGHKAVFVDARAPELFPEGHIQGAFSLPVQDFEARFFDFLKAVPSEARIIVYCDGEACELSHDLAKLLKQQGYARVQVLINGWSLWQENRLPLEKGN